MRQSHGDLLEFIFWRWEETASTEFLDKVSEKVEEGRGKKKEFPRGSVGWRSALVMAVALVTKKKKEKKLAFDHNLCSITYNYTFLGRKR